jgi:diguanylate cyclase (GGDEF)-like protein
MMPTSPSAPPAVETADDVPARQGQLLRELGVLDRPADAELTAALRLACALTGVPFARFNLLDTDRQLTLTAVGDEAGEVPRAHSVCARTSRRPGVFWSADLSADPEFSDHPFVTGEVGALRFYASAPIDIDGVPVATVCLYDTRPRAVTDEQLQQLADVAELARGIILRGRYIRRAAELATAAEDARAELARARAFDRALLDSLSVGVVASDATGEPRLVNKVMQTWLEEQCAGEQVPDPVGREAGPDELVPNLFEVDGVTPVPYGRTALRRALRGEWVRDVEQIAAAPGRPRRQILSSAEPVHDDRGGLIGAVVTATDVTRQRQLEDRLREAALHDPLTGLPNRSLLLDRVEQVLTAQRRSGSPATLIYCDLDGFKRINDTAGHAAGDAALRHAAAAIRSGIRGEDTVARLGGDEFAVLCPGLRTTAEARAVIGRIHAALAEGSTPLQCSAGFARSAAGDTAEALLVRADDQMYTVKRARRAGC